MTDGILLVGHGSREAAGNAQFLALAGALAERVPHLAVEPCFLDHAEPSVQAGIDRLVVRGVRAVAVVPLFLFAAGHAKRDLPAHLGVARERHPAVAFHYGRPLGVHPALVRICAGRLAEAAHGVNRAETAVLLVGRGSSDPEANAELCKVARLLWEETRYGFVEPAYSDVTLPRVPDGLARCIRLGARRVILLPYFLFKGVLMDRLKALLAEWQTRTPDVAFLFANAQGLGAGGGLVDLVLERALEALGGQGTEA